jgi:hypothetical protein
MLLTYIQTWGSSTLNSDKVSAKVLLIEHDHENNSGAAAAIYAS